MTKARDLANGGFGLVLIKPSSVVNGTDNGKGTISFSAASTVSLNDVFNSTYSNYRILLESTGSTTANIGMRLRVSNTDTTTNYSRQYIYGTAVSLSSGRSTGDSNWITCNINTGFRSAITMDVYNPFLTVATNCSTFSNSLYPTGNDIAINNFGQDSGTSFTGFTLTTNTGTMTGTVSVYGYNK